MPETLDYIMNQAKTVIHYYSMNQKSKVDQYVQMYQLCQVNQSVQMYHINKRSICNVNEYKAEYKKSEK